MNNTFTNTLFFGQVKDVAFQLIDAAKLPDFLTMSREDLLAYFKEKYKADFNRLENLDEAICFEIASLAQDVIKAKTVNILDVQDSRLMLQINENLYNKHGKMIAVIKDWPLGLSALFFAYDALLTADPTIPTISKFRTKLSNNEVN